MIYGPAEHDTCSMGMGGMHGEPAQEVTDGQYLPHLICLRTCCANWQTGTTVRFTIRFDCTARVD